MKLETSILPRKDGVVIVEGLNGVKLVFAPDADGFMVAEVEHAPTVAHLLTLGTFTPADEEDHVAAEALIAPKLDPVDDNLDDDEPLMDDDGPVGLPIEANTPPAKLKKGVRVKKQPK